MQLETFKTDVAQQSGIPREKLEAKVREKMEKFAGLLNEESAWLMVGREHGIEIHAQKNWVPIGKLSPNQYGASVRGTVQTVFEPRTFERNGRTGQNQSILLQDDTGEIRLTLWNDQVDDARKKGLARGSIVEIDFANTNEYNGKTQLQLAKNTPLRITPPEIEAHPKRANAINTHSKLGALTADTRTNAVARVLAVFPIKDFDARDGRKNTRAGALLADDTATVRLVAWGKKALEIQSVETGDAVEIIDGLVKKGLREDLEIQLNDRSQIRRIEQNDAPNPRAPTATAGTNFQLDPETQNSLPTAFDLLAAEYPEKKLNQQPSGNVRATGTIESVDDRTGVFWTCPNCAGKTENGTVDSLCVRCGAIQKPRAKAVLAVQFNDSTAMVRTRLFGRAAETLLQKTSAEIADGLDDETKNALVGKKIEILASAKENAYSNENELTVKTWRETA